MSEIVKIKLEDIIPNKSQPRLDFYDESIEGLAESIKENGLLQPVTVRRQGDKYELIAGERRFRAHQFIQAKEIDAIVLDKNDDESAKLALIENIQREDLNAIETALAMKRIMLDDNLTQEELATRLGYKQSTVANKLRLLKLPEYIKNAIGQGIITERHARALLKVDEDKLEETYLTIVNKKYNVAKTEEYIKSLGKIHTKSVGAVSQMAINTFKKTANDCIKMGVDLDFNTTEYEDYVKVVIRVKK